MAANKRTVRKPDEVERSHNATAVETVAFGTTAASMLLGLLAGSAQAHQASSPAHDGTHRDAVPPADGKIQPAAPAATSNDAPAPHAAEAPQTDASVGLDATAHTGADLHLSTAGTSTIAATTTVSVDTPHIDVGSATHAALEIEQPAGPEPLAQSVMNSPLPAQPLNLGTTIAATLDASFATLSSTIAALTSDVQHIVSNLSGLTGSLTATATSLTQWTLSVPDAAVGTLVSTVFDSHAGSPAPLIDTSGLMPVSEVLAPLTLGFAGQPQPDGHETHDGAFSALGLHHF